MTQKTTTLETPVLRRSTYIDVNTGETTMTTEPTEELKQTIAEAREAQAAEFRARISELEDQVQHYQNLADTRGKELEEMHLAITELKAEPKKAPRGVEVEAYEYEEDDLVIVQIDTAEDTGKIRVYVNDGVIYEGDPEAVEEDAEAEVEADDQAAGFFRIVEQRLRTHGNGPGAILDEVQHRKHIERVTYLAHLDHLAEVMQQNTDNLRDLATRSRIAAQMVE